MQRRKVKKGPSLEPFTPDEEEGKNAKPLMSVVDWVLVSVFTLLSFGTRFYKLTSPDVVLFDEVHFGKFVNAHLTGHFYFDIHPPLVKLLMAGLLRLTTNYQADQAFETIGEPIKETTPLWTFRFIPALAGSLIVPAIFFISKRLNLSQAGSVLCTSMACFDNLLLGESREILTDSCLILFICLAILSHLSAEQQILHSKWWYRWTALTGLFLGCALSTKWTSLSVFGIVGISTVVDLCWRFRRMPTRKAEALHVKDFFTRALLLLGIPVCLYVSCFILYFWTLPKSGQGDAFMPVSFRSTLIGNNVRQVYRVPSFWDNFFALNIEMFRANRNVATPHHWQSYWYTWPFNHRGIACWNGKISHVRGETYQAFVYLLGNPFVWWFSTLCLVFSPIVFLLQHKPWQLPATVPTRSVAFAPTSSFPGRFAYLMFQLYTGWVTSILPYALISRACFIYHYMPSLIFAILITGVLLDVFFETLRLPIVKFIIYGLLICIFVSCFWFFLPLSYGDEMTVDENKSRRWFESWN